MRSWLLFSLIVVLSLCGCLPRVAMADRGGYVIEQFDVELTVESNSDLLVEERLLVDFSQPRHGIFRTIPVQYTDPKGYAYSLGFRLLDVTDENGRRQATKTSSRGRYKKIRIGDPDRTVHGRVTYVIRYRIRDAIGHFSEHDELYWNVAGHEWNAAIRKASAVVRLPASLPQDSLEVAGYTGRFGGQRRAVRVAHPQPGVIQFDSIDSFDPLEGLTVVVAWPHGYVQFPSATVRAGRFVADNWIVIFPLGWFAFLWKRYRRSGRDPDEATSVAVQYEPPPGITPGGVGTLIDERVDLRDITATIVDLAVRGYLAIRVEPRDVLFGLFKSDNTIFVRKEGPSRGDLAKHEKKVLDAIFARGDEVDTKDLKNRFYKAIPGIQDALYERLVRKGYFDSSPKKVRSGYIVVGFLAGLVTAGLGVGWLWMRGATFPVAFILPAIVGAATAALFALFAPAMPRKTSAGVRARQWALGFQEFAQRVEEDRLQRVEPRQLFESLLPYAMALDVAGEWAKKFEGIYDSETPGWFVGQHPGRGFSTLALEQSLTSAMTRASQSMAASPRSSGSGGGGFSGGGGGGGGGGSW